MKKRNILIALFMALVMTVTACSPGAEKKKAGDDKAPVEEKKGDEKADDKKDAPGGLKGEITVQAEKAWLPYYEATVKRLNEKNPDAKVTIKEVESFKLLDTIKTTSAEDENVTDVFSIPADRLEELAGNDVLSAMPAKEMADRVGGFEDYDKSLGGILKVGEEYFAFPFNIETLVTFVNKKNAETAGIDHTKPFEMTEQKNVETILLPIFDAWFGVAPNNAAGMDLLARKDGKFESTYTKEYKDLSADQKAVFDALYGYWKQNDEAKTPLFDADAGWGYLDDQFKTGGKGVIRLGGPWELAGFIEKAGEENLEVYPIGHITVAKKPLIHWQGGWGLAINSRIEEDKDKFALATAFIEELMNPQFAVDLFKATGKIMPNVKADTFSKSDLSDLEKKTIELTFESFAVSTPRPTYQEYGSVWDTWKNAVLSWPAKKPANAEDAYKELNAAFTAMMQQIGK